jgi:GNAT superfamily N-acetyltransferase
MTLVYRPACEQDLPRAETLVVASINDLTERHGFGAIAGPRPTAFQQFSLREDPGGLWVAEEDDAILGFAWSWTCAELWFLAQLFVLPDQQGRGIGNELLTRTFAHAEQSGAKHRALITFPFNIVAQGLYLKNGLLPRCPIYMLNVPPKRIIGRVAGPMFDPRPLAATAAHLRELASIDAQALGTSREKHHRYLLNDGSNRAFGLYADGDCVGYVYISPEGHIGPLAAKRDDALGAAFATALNLAAELGSPQVSAFLPGTADAALEIAAAHGMRITLPMVLMATPGFGNWTRYLPRNPGFM